MLVSTHNLLCSATYRIDVYLTHGPPTVPIMTRAVGRRMKNDHHRVETGRYI
jgi:hypothetical protein